MQLALAKQQAPQRAPGTISVVIPSYGHANYVKTTLDSILRQTRQPYEIILINDGSPDDTASAVQPYLAKITYIEQENRGVVATLNRGLQLATGEYVWMLASDDWLEDYAFATLADILDTHPDVGIAHGDVTFVDGTGRALAEEAARPIPLGKHRDLALLIGGNFVSAPATLCRREALLAVGTFPDRPFCHDWAMWLRVLIAGWSLYGTPEHVTCYRRHGRNLSGRQNRARALHDDLSMLDSLGREFRSSWTVAEVRALQVSMIRVRRNLGWCTLADNQRTTARRCFARLAVEHPDGNSFYGLFLAILPTPLYATLRALNARARPDSRGNIIC